MPERDDLLPVAHGLPTLRGEPGLLMVGGCPTLVVHAVYRPPVGSLGALADLLGLQRVAWCTTTGFLETVADRLTARPRVPA